MDSSGTFTIDLERSRATLQRFQLASANHYVLPLVACAVAGGAESLSFSRRGVDLEGLAVDLAGSSYLHSALACLDRLVDVEVSGESWDGHTGSRFRLVRGQLEVTALAQASSVRTRLVLTPTRALESRLLDAVRWVAGVGPARDPAEQLLRSYARYCPVPIRVNGRQFNLERQGHWKLLAVLNDPPLQLRPLGCLRQTRLVRDVPFAGYLGLGMGGGGALVIVDGLLYPLELPGAPADFRAILWHPDLQRDLSLLKLVKNEQLAEFCQQLGQIFAAVRAGC